MGVWTQPSFETSKLSAGRRCQCQSAVVIAGRSEEGDAVDTFVWYAFLLLFFLFFVDVRELWFELWFGRRPVAVLLFHRTSQLLPGNSGADIRTFTNNDTSIPCI